MSGDPFNVPHNQITISLQSTAIQRSHKYVGNINNFWSIGCKWISAGVGFRAALYLCLWRSTGLSVMCGTRQWITYQSYWSRYSDVDGVSAGSPITNHESVHWLWTYSAFPSLQRPPQIVRHAIIGGWTNISLGRRWQLVSWLDFTQQKIEECFCFHVCFWTSSLKRNTKEVISAHWGLDSWNQKFLYQPINLKKGQLNDNLKM